MGWGWLLSVWGLGILFVVGVSLLLLGAYVEGVLTLGFGVLVHHRVDLGLAQAAQTSGLARSGRLRCLEALSLRFRRD